MITDNMIVKTMKIIMHSYFKTLSQFFISILKPTYFHCLNAMKEQIEKWIINYPWVVDAVTLTTIIVAGVRISCKTSLLFDFSRMLLPNSYKNKSKNYSQFQTSFPLPNTKVISFTNKMKNNKN